MKWPRRPEYNSGMKRVEKKLLTPDELVAGPLINWSGDIHTTLKNLWSNIEINTPRFYQKSFKFDRPTEHEAESIRQFFMDRGVFAAVRNYSDPNVGNRSWLTIIALSDRYSKYKSTMFFE